MPTAVRHSFRVKAAAALLLVVLADALFYGAEPGWTLGGFALAWIAVLLAAVPAMRRRARVPLAIAALFALVLIEAPGPLALLLFLAAIGTAALLPRARADDVLRWTARMAAFGILGSIAALRDTMRLSRRPAGRVGMGRVARLLLLPLAGTVLFGTLFAGANPLIGRALAGLALPDLDAVACHVALWAFVLALVWPSLRPRHGRVAALLPQPGRALALPVATVALSLLAFNLMFGIENALDIAYLWRGAALPAGVTLADYAHRGAYTLIATALLAGGFVLLFLDPASPAAASRPVRWLVTLWVGQNVVLVASSIRRLLDYVAAYSLTELRVAALAWMALVGVGLLLVLWRLVAGKPAHWLINANALAAGLVLASFTVIDTGGLVAEWNVAHARSSDDLDLCYLGRLGSSALLPLIELERRAGGQALRDTAAARRERILARLTAEQADWHSWSWRGARRLARAQALLGAHPYHPTTQRNCAGKPTGSGNELD